MTVTQHQAKVAEKQGKERGLAGAEPSSNPHTDRVLAAAWRIGHLEGVEIRAAHG